MLDHEPDTNNASPAEPNGTPTPESPPAEAAAPESAQTATAAAETVPAEPAPAETAPAETAPAETAPARPRRRRAASRPAGPPSPVTEEAGSERMAPPAAETVRDQTPAPPVTEPTEAAPTGTPPTGTPPTGTPSADTFPAETAQATAAVETPSLAEPTAAEPIADAPEAAPARPVRKTATRRTRKVAEDGDQEAAPARAPRRRAPRKTAEPVATEVPVEPVPAEPAAVDSAPVEPTVTEPTAEDLSVVAPALATPTVPATSEAVEPPAEPAEGTELVVDADPLSQLGEADDAQEPEVQQPDAAEPVVPESDSADAEDTTVLAPAAEDVDAEPVALDEAELELAPAEDVEGVEDEDGAEADAEDDTEADADGEAREGDGRRRRRRRGGRRRRRGAGDDTDAAGDESADGEQSETGTDVGASDATEVADGTAESDGAEAEAAEEGDGEATRRRRRRRRRRGEDAGSTADDPATEVVVRVREPRRTKASNEVTGIDGSTRMEAKRQRRREGREAGRRRPPILSEAEFLARRESVNRKMIVRQRDDLSQIAVLEDDVLVEHYVDRESTGSLIGNVYLGRVQNVLPSMEAAFIDIGRGRNAVLYAGEVDWDSFGAEGQQRKVERVLKSGQSILVQVTKDPVGAKGARLTNHVSIPGRYIVYAPGGHLSGISRKLPDTERRRLKDILSDLIGDNASVIVRTAAEGASEEELVRDVNRLKAQWADIERKVAAGHGPQLLYGEPDLTVRIVRDLFTEDFGELIIQGNGGMTDAYESVEAYVTHVAPHLADRLRRWESDRDLFAEYRLDEQIAKALERKVFLPSGGSLVIDRTEAMTVIDVNTGKFTGSGGNLEATVTSNNLEAAEEIVRQLRLRDIGGIIVVDFIDMVLPSNRELLLRRLVECLGRDRTRHQVAEVTSLGLVQMTRKKIGTGLLEAFTSECEHCHGRGVELHELPVEAAKPDGGVRENRSRDRRGGPGGRGRTDKPDESANGRAVPEPPPVVPTPLSPVEPTAEADQGAEPAGTADEAPAETAPRARRGGRRRAATREQGAPEATPAAEPAPVG